jgi:ABC-type phosphate/phosphonate transport system permease subunit
LAPRFLVRADGEGSGPARPHGRADDAARSGLDRQAVLFIKALFETLAIAFLGTLLAAIIAFPIGFIAARNTTIHRLVQFASRRVLDGIRGIDALIWALLWINVVGLGPFAACSPS